MAQRLAPTESSRAEGTLTLQEEGGAQKQSGAAAGEPPARACTGGVTVSLEQAQAGPRRASLLVTQRSVVPGGMDGAKALSFGPQQG